MIFTSSITPSINHPPKVPKNYPRGNLGSTTVNPEMTAGQAFVMEIILTFTLIFVIFASAVDKKGHGTIAPILIGITVTIDILVGKFNGRQCASFY